MSNKFQTALLLIEDRRNLFRDHFLYMKKSSGKEKGFEETYPLHVDSQIGKEYIKGEYSDIIVCSMGKWKIIDNKEGGFISFKEYQKELIEISDFELDWNKLNEKVDRIPERNELLKKRCELVKKDLSEFEIIHKEKKSNSWGINK